MHVCAYCCQDPTGCTLEVANTMRLLLQVKPYDESDSMEWLIPCISQWFAAEDHAVEAKEEAPIVTEFLLHQGHYVLGDWINQQLRGIALGIMAFKQTVTCGGIEDKDVPTILQPQAFTLFEIDLVKRRCY